MAAGGSRKARSGRAARAAATAVDTAARAGETALAAAEVIGKRSRLIGEALADPRKLADPELTTMVSEKVEAAQASGSAMARGLPAAARAGQLWLSRQRRLATEAALAAARPRPPLHLLQLWGRLGWRSLEAFVDAAQAAAHGAARATAAGLAPIHRKATRNAKRLRRKR